MALRPISYGIFLKITNSSTEIITTEQTEQYE